MSYVERRFLPSSEIRATGSGSKMQVSGYAARYNSRWDDASTKRFGWVEQIKSGAFDRAVRERQDCKLTVNHDPSLLLGRTKSGTLRLESDTRGLRITCDLPDTQTARDYFALVKRGDLSQMSFAFVPKKDRWYKENGLMCRDIEDVDLEDVSIVTYPAYADTEVNSINEAAVNQARQAHFPNGMPLECRNAFAFARLPQVDRDIIEYEQRKNGKTDLDMMGLRVSEAYKSALADLEFE